MTRYVDRRQTLKKQLQDIDLVMLQAEVATDLDVKSYLQRFAIVRLSGYLETSVELMVNGYLEENSAHRILRYGQANAKKIMNLNPDKLENLLGSFDSGWRESLHNFLAIDERRQTLGNLIKARHDLAHGKSTGADAQTLERYHTLAEATVRHLADLLLPTN
jgi:hypothetical protein